MPTNGSETGRGGNHPAGAVKLNRAEAGFPLASLVLLVSALAILLSCIDVGRWREQYNWIAEDWWWRGVGLFGLAGLLGAGIGLIHLFVFGFSWRAFFIAPLVGAVAGEIGLMILMAPGPLWRTIFALGILVVTAILVRLTSD